VDGTVIEFRDPLDGALVLAARFDENEMGGRECLVQGMRAVPDSDIENGFRPADRGEIGRVKAPEEARFESEPAKYGPDQLPHGAMCRSPQP
jgi:hypothetical protein